MTALIVSNGTLYSFLIFFLGFTASFVVYGALWYKMVKFAEISDGCMDSLCGSKYYLTVNLAVI